MASIFTITVFNWQKGCEIPDHRTWGWFPTFEEAEEYTKSGPNIMFKNDTYHWALIEEVPEGVISIAENRTWYVKVVGEEQALQISDPDWANGVINFSMG